MFENFSNFYDSGQESSLLLQKLAIKPGGADRFFDLFPHRFDYIYAPHPEPGESAHWQTERRHPLSDRLLSQGSYLYGVRFGKTTHYCLLDIDAKSAYHPHADPLAIARILASLETLGLVNYLACTSSYSGGLHLYFPFQQAQRSWEVGTAVTAVLENAGFIVKPGQLEVFPNRRNYSVTGKPSLFNAHRLPLQMGSYLLNRDFEPIWSDRPRFVDYWKAVQTQNQISAADLHQLIKQIQRRHYQVSGKAAKFLNDLNAEIEPGWTDYGQTNYLLGRIAMRAYVFNHILEGGAPLAGSTLIEQIVRTARSLPGYEVWCQHQHEIEKRAAEWGRCVESSHYFHYGAPDNQAGSSSNQRSIDPPELSWNQKQAEATRERIKQAIVDLLNRNKLPVQATARFKLLTSYGIGGGSLYRHKDLWHPGFLTSDLAADLSSAASSCDRSIYQSGDRSSSGSLNLDLNSGSNSDLNLELDLNQYCLSVDRLDLNHLDLDRSSCNSLDLNLKNLNLNSLKNLNLLELQEQDLIICSSSDQFQQDQINQFQISKWDDPLRTAFQSLDNSTNLLLNLGGNSLQHRVSSLHNFQSLPNLDGNPLTGLDLPHVIDQSAQLIQRVNQAGVDQAVAGYGSQNQAFTWRFRPP